MDEDDVIRIETPDEPADDGVPIIAIARHSDGSVSFKTTLSSPAEFLWVLKHIEKTVLEDYEGWPIH